MKLATSTGDFRRYVDSVAEKIRRMKGTKFKCVNLEQTGTIPAFYVEICSNTIGEADPDTCRCLKERIRQYSEKYDKYKRGVLCD